MEQINNELNQLLCNSTKRCYAMVCYERIKQDAFKNEANN